MILSTPFQRIINRHGLALLIAGVISVAMSVTVLNMILYVNSGASSLDLSRPDYEKLRAQVRDNAATKDQAFDSTGTLDQAALDQFMKTYASKRQATAKLGAFQDQSLTDESLRFSQPATEVLPSE